MMHARGERGGIMFTVCSVLLMLAVIIGSVTVIPHVTFRVHGTSMMSTLHSGDYVVGSTHDASKVSRGDVIVFEEPENWGGSDSFIKRVAGVAGDVISIDSDGRVSVNGVEYARDSVYENGCGATENTAGGASFTVPDGEVFVMGDNVNNSHDSRYEYCTGNTDPFVSVSRIKLVTRWTIPVGLWTESIKL